jgi:2-keto-4-pentenoate hydratase
MKATSAIAAKLLLNARAEGCALRGLPEAALPTTPAEAYAIQRAVIAELGDIGGWKVGAAGPDAEPSCAPLPAQFVLPSPASLSAADFPRPFVESEIAFRIGADLPVREHPYDAAEVQAAIASCHPAIELVQSRFADPDAAGALANLADLIRHGAFIWGETIDRWAAIDFPGLSVTQTMTEGKPRGGVGNPAGDMMRLLVWLANEGARWAGGLRAGQFVTCGSWTGMTPVTTWPADIATVFDGAPPVRLHLGEAGKACFFEKKNQKTFAKLG